MSLFARVASTLERARIPHALIGASALAAHGVPRSTVDQDLFTVERACLAPEPWDDLRASGITVEVRRGDASDPLAGVVRFELPGERPVDLVIGKHPWQREAIERAQPLGAGPPVVQASDLVLLKLYAGGLQDAWDIQQLLHASADRDRLIGEVESDLDRLPRDCARLWQEVLGTRRS